MMQGLCKFEHMCLPLPLSGISLVFTYDHALQRVLICIPTKPHQASSFPCAILVSPTPARQAPC